MDASKCLLFAIFSAVMFSSCFAGINSPYKSKTSWNKCSYPNWKCDCKLHYNCDTANTGFPDDDLGSTSSGVVKDLAPGDYPMQMAGKRWRRNFNNQRAYCERECFRRMNAFLCLDDGDDTAYSRAAVCTKLQQEDVVAQNAGFDEPCCEVFLQWGPQWCNDKWYKSVLAVTCEGVVVAAFPADTVIVTPTTCTVGTTSGPNNWCTGTAPDCTL